MTGRPTTPRELVRQRKMAWDRAVRFSSRSQEEIAEVIGMSLATVRSYSSANGNAPTEAAIDALKRDNLLRAVDTIAERYGAESIPVGGPRP